MAMKLLVAIDLSEASSAVLREAMNCAKPLSARVWLLHVVASGPDRFLPIKDAIYIYSRDGGEHTWKLPEDWRGVPVEIFSLSRTGRQPAPPHRLEPDSLWIRLPPRTPVKMLRKR